MDHLKPRLLIVPVLSLLVAAAVAFAEPARNGTVSASSPVFKWEGTGSGILATQDAMDAAGCTPGIHDCDDTLLKVENAGQLTIKTTSSDPAAADTDLQLFESDESGKVGKQLQEGAKPTPDPNEQVSAAVEPGYYIARIDYAVAAQGVVNGEATLEPDPAAGGVGGEVTGGAPAANRPPTAKIKAPRGKRIKSFSGTAADADGSVANVVIGLLQLGSGGKCKVLTSAKGTFKTQKGRCSEPTKYLKAKGGAKWSFKLSKALKKGRYVLFARATDDKGLSETGYGAANKKSFRVK